MLCIFNLLLGDILLHVLKRLLLKAYMTYKTDLFYYTQDTLCYIKRTIQHFCFDSLREIFNMEKGK